MKLKCKDGVVRRFKISQPNWRDIGWDEGECEECGHLFGVHDTKIIKPMFYDHVCAWRCIYCGWKGTNPDRNLHGNPRCPNCDSGQPLSVN